uniref:Serine aminopeptidase S33 domain-containing protein n=1 Tax=Favella ehrenbergii TaxID=182087 RepID=A0A7S3HUJ0_9SPIT|mmetsp:Transcript_11543/g.14537  ORF Transcript_11543/g.14537 Transcript_11543/m.14537 type:complete len:187 (+) Transcript_11543:716-1276(+)
MFLFGRSFGGLLATNMANTLIGKSMFAGVVLLTPYYRLFTERLYEAYKWLIPLTTVKPNHKFMCEYSEMDPEWAARYEPILNDSRNVNFFTATTARLWVEQQELARSSVAHAPQPFCFIAATGDGVVRNDYIEDFADLTTNEEGELHRVVGADHTDVVFDQSYGSQVMRISTSFLDKLVEARSPLL